jgi:diguanylate cyclase (GGDEF)-like protein
MILSKPNRNEISHATMTMAAAGAQERLQGDAAALRDSFAKIRNSVRALLASIGGVAPRNQDPAHEPTEQHQAAKDESRAEVRRALGAPIRSQFFLSDWRWPLMKWAIPIAVLWCLAEVWTSTSGPRVLGISVFGLVLVAGWLAAVKARASNPSRALAIVDYLYVGGAFLLLLTLWVLLATARWEAAQTLTGDLLIWAPLIAGFASFTYARTPSVAIGFTVATYSTLIAAVYLLGSQVGAAWQYVPVHSLLAQGAATLLAGVFFSRFRDSVSLTIAKLRIAESHSFQDTLTGLANRRKFDLDWQGQRERGAELSLILLDVDHFKTINDRFGHAVGDEVLLEMAERIRRATDGVATAYRWGGEEFAVIVPGAGLQVRHIARRVVDAVVAEAFDGVGRVTISAGTASPSGGETPETVFQRADSALLHAKALGRNRVSWAARTATPALVFPVEHSSTSIYANRLPAEKRSAQIRLCQAA